MSTFIRSPCWMNSGTWITAPVSSLAGLEPPDCRQGGGGQEGEKEHDESIGRDIGGWRTTQVSFSEMPHFNRNTEQALRIFP